MLTRRNCIVVLTGFAALSFSLAHADEPHLRALEAKAVCVALAQYRVTSPKADLRHFQITVGKDGKNFDIIFLPDPDPSDRIQSAAQRNMARRCITSFRLELIRFCRPISHDETI